MRTLVYICLLFGAALSLTNALPARAQTAARGKIAFLSRTPAGADLFVLDLDRDLQTNVTQGRLAGIAAAAWSPDGTRLVVSADRGSNLYVVGADGVGLRALTQNTGFAITQTPTWSPDGKQIAFVCDAAPNYDVCVVGADGSNRRRLTNTNSVYRDLAWSPDGKLIAYASGPGFFDTRIFVMNADGTQPRQLSSGQGADLAPAWSPDGKAIAYENDFQSGPADIFVMNADGGGQSRLTGDFHSDRHPTWSPDGKTIAFASDRGGAYAIYLMNPDGTGQARATAGTAEEMNPAWQPDPTLAQPTPTPAYSVSGRVTDGRGNGIPDAAVTLSGSAGAVTTTDAASNYSFNGLPAGGSYNLSPSKAGQYLTFSAGVGNLNGNQTVNLILVPYVTVFVRVTDAAGDAVPAVAVRLGEQSLGSPLTNTAGTVTINVTYPASGDATFKLTPSKYGYAFSPPETSFSTRDGNQSFSFNAALANRIYDTQFFVRQHYLDFFGREPDATGLAFWTQGVETCGASDGCREVKRIDTSAAFFLSIEFRETGYLAYRTYKAAYGNMPGKPVPLKLSEFTGDSQRIGQGVVVNAPGWAELLESNKQGYFNAFVGDARFAAAYPASLTPAQFVDALNANAGQALSADERAALVTGLTDGTLTRAQVLRAVAEDSDLARAELNRAFVLMQYFGYLRRDPDAAPDADFTGYQFWLSKLEGFGGDYRRAEMVKAFISSDEYRKRFGQ
jgi:roadblock/LC7 domain-containing protein